MTILSIILKLITIFLLLKYTEPFTKRRFKEKRKSFVEAHERNFEKKCKYMDEFNKIPRTDEERKKYRADLKRLFR